MLKTATEKFASFWLEGDARRPLAAFALAWALTVLCDIFFVWIPTFDLMFSATGPYSASSSGAAAAPWNALAWLGALPALRAACVVLIVSLLGVATGRAYRLSIIASAYLLACFHDLSPQIFFANHSILRACGFYLVFAPSRVGTRAGGMWVLRLIQLQFALIYLFAFAYKLGAPLWRSGEATLIAAQMTGYTTMLTQVSRAGEVLPDFVFRLATWAVLACEGLIAVGLWLPRWRGVFVCLGVVLHVIIFVVMDIPNFQQMMIAGLMAFVDWNEVFRRFGAAPPKA